MICCLMPCRNEDWILGLSLRAALMWCDSVVILDHASNDDTAEIIRDVSAEFPGRVVTLRDDNPEWQEMRHRHWLLAEARSLKPDVVALVDADEVLSGNLLPVIQTMMPKPGSLLQLPWACLARGLGRYYTSGVWFDNWVSCGFVDHKMLHWSASSRGGYDFHQRHPMGMYLNINRPLAQKVGGLMHLQFVNERRLRAKQALYQVTEVLRWPGRETPAELAAKYGRAVYESDPVKYSTESVPDSWWRPYEHLMKYVDLDAVPWQEEAVRRAIAQHGREKFKGLDLFGVDQ